MKRLGKIYKIISILVYTFLFTAIWLPWVTYGGKSYCLPAYIRMVNEAGGIVDMTNGDPSWVASYYLFFVPLLGSTFAVIYIIGGLAKKNVRLFWRLVQWCEFLYTVTAIILFPMVPMGWTYVLPILCLAEFVISQYAEQRDEILREARIRAERERLEKDERKRRLYFPGRYSIYYYKMILKNVKYHIRNYVMLILSGTFLMIFLYLVFALWRAFQGVHTKEAVIGGEIQAIMLSAVWIGLLLNAVLMGFSFSYYIRNKMQEEKALVLLGIRSKSLTSIMMMEYVGCLMCSVVLGIGLGSLLFRFLISMLQKRFAFTFQWMPPSTYLLMLTIFLVAALVAAAVNGHVYEHMRWSAAGLLEPKKNRIPGLSGWIRGGLGAVLICVALLGLSKRSGGEDVGLQGWYLIGVYWLILCILSAQMKRLKADENRYYGQVFGNLTFLTRFRENLKKVYLLTLIAFFVMYTFSSIYIGIAAAPSGEEQYPYDYVCTSVMGEEEFFTELGRENEGEMYDYPMVTTFTSKPNKISVLETIKGILTLRYTAVSNGREVLPVLPVQIGIPEFVYIELKEKKYGEKPEALGLTGEEIAVVYQEDTSVKAHILDWLRPEEGIHLQTLNPDLELYGFEAYQAKKVQKEERDILTGVCSNGMWQNLIVFSDEYFQELFQGERMYLLNTGEAYDKVGDLLTEKAVEEETINFYGRKSSIQDMETERYLKQVIWLFMTVMTGVCGIYLIFIKFCFEMDEIVERYRFLDCMGMHENTLKKTLRSEMLPFFALPFIAGGGSAVIFSALTFKVRMYTGEEIMKYLCYALPVWLFYWLIQAAVYQVLKRVLLGKIIKYVFRKGKKL